MSNTEVLPEEIKPIPIEKPGKIAKNTKAWIAIPLLVCFGISEGAKIPTFVQFLEDVVSSLSTLENLADSTESFHRSVTEFYQELTQTLQSSGLNPYFDEYGSHRYPLITSHDFEHQQIPTNYRTCAALDMMGILRTPDPIDGSFNQIITPEHQEFIYQAAAEYNLNPNVLATLITIESAGNPNAHSYTTNSQGQRVILATGLTQVVHHFHNEYTEEQLLDPRTNIFAGAGILDAYLNRKHNLLGAGLAAYNGGPNRSYLTTPDQSMRYCNRAFVHLSRIYPEQVHPEFATFSNLPSDPSTDTTAVAMTPDVIQNFVDQQPSLVIPNWDPDIEASPFEPLPGPDTPLTLSPLRTRANRGNRPRSTLA